MAIKQVVYKAELVGIESSSHYVTKLSSDPLFRVRVTEEPNVTRIEIVGPLKESVSGNYEEILAHCQLRASVIEGGTTDLAKSTAGMIVDADTAERLVLALPIKLTMSVQSGLTLAELFLTVADRGPDEVRACIPHYAEWRIGCVAQVMGMSYEIVQVN